MRPFALSSMASLPVVLALALLAPGCSKTTGSDQAASMATAAAPPSAAPQPQAAAALPSLGNFEGEIDLLMKSADRQPPENEMSLALLVKEGKVRADIPPTLAKGEPLLAGGSYAIFDSAAKKLAMVVDPRKQVVVLDLNKSVDDLKGMTPPAMPGRPPPPAPKPENPPTITQTGKYDTVAGYKCEYWDVVSQDKDKGKGSVCVAEMGASWLSLPSLHLPTQHAWMSRWLDGQHLPLRFIGYDKDGHEKDRFEATKIDKKTLPESMFQYPPSYQVVDVEQMMRGMMGAMMHAGAMPAGSAFPPMPHHPSKRHHP